MCIVMLLLNDSSNMLLQIISIFSTGSKGTLVVLLLEVSRNARYHLFHPTQEGQPGVFSSCLPSCHHVPDMVHWGKMGCWWTM